VQCHPDGNETPSPEVYLNCRERLITELEDVKPTKILTVGAIGLSALLGLDSPIPITKSRGLGQYATINDQTYFVVPTIHPAAVLRTPDWFRELADDIIKFKYQDRPHEPPRIQTLVVKGSESALEELRDLKQRDVVSCDLETTGLNPKRDIILSFGFGIIEGSSESQEPQGYSVIVPIEVAEIPEVRDEILNLLESDNIRIPFHNLKFDLQFLIEWAGGWVDIKGAEDTMIMHYMLDERTGTGYRTPGHSLKVLGRRYDIPDFSFDFEDFYAGAAANYPWQEFYHEPDWDRFYEVLGVDDDQMIQLWEYHGLDLYVTARLFEDFRDEILDESEDLWNAYRTILLPGAKAFAEIELNGVPIDREYLEGYSIELEEQIRGLESYLQNVAEGFGLHSDPIEFDVDDLRDIGRLLTAIEDEDETISMIDSVAKYHGVRTMYNGDPEHRGNKSMLSRTRNVILRKAEELGLYRQGEEFSPNSPNQVKAFVKALGLRVDRTQKDDLWLAMSQQGASPEVRETIDRLIQYRLTTKVKATYVDGILDRIDSDGLLRPNYLLWGAATGRLACEDPNLMNIPQLMGDQVHRAFIAPPGWVFANVDYSQLELRTAAVFSNDPAMISAYLDDRDIHREVASSMFGKSPEEITYFERYMAKYVDFGVIYGRGAKSLVEGWEMEYMVQQGEERWTVVQAETFLRNFLDQFEGLKSWIEEQHRQVVEVGYVETLSGRRRRFPYIDPYNRSSIERQAVNSPIQGTASDICLNALVALHNRFMEMQSPIAYVLFTVHDSIAFLIQESHLDQALSMIREEMVDNALIKAPFPFKIDAEIGPHWGDLSQYDWNRLIDGLPVN